jgi:[ribosomal protein S5]-alanine N-acetyltransferase
MKKKKNQKLNIYLKKLSSKNITKKWISWLNDKIVNRYGDKGLSNHSIKSQKKWFNNKIIDNAVILGVYIDNSFAGVSEISQISKQHKNCQISYMIGEKSYWNKGYGNKLINLLCIYAKKKFRVKKIIASTFENNFASQKVLLKNNFNMEGKIKNFYKYNNKRVSRLYFGKNV